MVKHTLVEACLPVEACPTPVGADFVGDPAAAGRVIASTHRRLSGFPPRLTAPDEAHRLAKPWWELTCRRSRGSGPSHRKHPSPLKRLPQWERNYPIANFFNFLGTAAFFNVTYTGSPSAPYGGGASPWISGAR
ncbi:hypothetical protein QFZ41_002516 [Luteibacter sp. W1I16]